MFNPEIEIYELTDVVTASETTVKKLLNAGANTDTGYGDWF